MPLSVSLYTALIEVAKRQDLSVAIIGEGQNLTYFALRNAIDSCAAALAGKGIRQGQLIVVNFSRPELYLIVLFAASKVGASVVFASFADAARLAHKPDFLLTDDRVPPGERDGALVIDPSWFRRNQPDVAVAVDAGARIVFGTSGSTGKRKLVAVGEVNFMRRMQSRRAYIGGTTRLLCTMGARTAVAIESRAAALLAGGSVVLLPVTRDIPHYFDLYAINTMMATPLVLKDLLGLELPKKIYWALRKLTVGGAPPTPELLKDVAERICDDITIGYGNTELGGISHCSYATSDYRLGKVGKVLPGIAVAIVDDRGGRVEQGTVGHIRIRATAEDAAVTYVDTGGASGGQLVEGWFLPGDRGWFDADGNLFIAGRDDDLVNAGGNKFSLELIESEIEAAQNCQCMVLRPSNDEARLIILVTADRASQANPIVAFVQSRFPRIAVDAVYCVAEIKMTESAKKDRVEMARLFQTSRGLFKRVWPGNEYPGAARPQR